MNFDGEIPRENFDDFLAAFYSLFQVLSGSAWELVMYDCMRAHKNGGITGFLFIIVFFLLSNYIILNLLIGAILSNMGQDTDETRLAVTTRNMLKKQSEQIRARSAQVPPHYGWCVYLIPASLFAVQCKFMCTKCDI